MLQDIHNTPQFHIENALRCISQQIPSHLCGDISHDAPRRNLKARGIAHLWKMAAAPRWAGLPSAERIPRGDRWRFGGVVCPEFGLAPSGDTLQITSM